MTPQEQNEAAKLYALLYRGDNIYSVKKAKGDEVLRKFIGVVNEFKQYLKANENGK